MKTSFVFAFSVLALLAASGCGGGGGKAAEICDAAELTEALGKAEPGDVVKLGSCRIEGTFTVPAGVTLEGAGLGASIIAGEGDQPVLKVVTGAEPVRLAGVSIESNTPAGILVKGGGEAAIERVGVKATRGIGIGAEELRSLTLSEVALEGPVNADNANSFMPDVTAQDTATHGLVLVRVESASISNVTASGFAAFGALLVESTTTWQGGGVSGNMGTGLMVHAGSATLEGLEMCRTLQGMRFIPSYGGVFVAGASVETTGVEVCEGDGYGLLHDRVSARHVDLVARDNGDAAVWAQKCPSFELSGEGAQISGNRFAGVVLVETENAMVSGASIDANEITVRVFDETGAVEVGDGVQVVRPKGPVILENLSFSNNERAGILLDLGGGSMDDVTLDAVTVDGTGDQLGALAQDGTIPEGWDLGVTRTGATVVNDAALVGSLPIVGVVSTNSVPDASGISRDGVGAIIGDTG